MRMHDENHTAMEYIVSNLIIQYASLMNNFNRKQTIVKGIRMTINIGRRTRCLHVILSIIDAAHRYDAADMHRW